MSDTHCVDCGAEFKPDGCTTGYGADKQGNRHCFSCCGERDRKAMVETGRATLYLTIDGQVPFRMNRGPVLNANVSNWPGTLKIRAVVRKGRHNIARTRYDAWFTGPDGKPWHGTQYGENTQICRCRRVKS